jgi:hypothetical protein
LRKGWLSACITSGAKISDPAKAAEGLLGGERRTTSVLVKRCAGSGLGERCAGSGLGRRRTASGLGGRCAASGLGGNA